MHSSERLIGLDVFVAVADLGSFTAAAGRLSLTSSAVSKSIARLEARMGVRLFERTTRRLSLSEAGVVLPVPISDIVPVSGRRFESKAPPVVFYLRP